MIIEGDYTDAKVFINDDDDLEENAKEQIQEMVNHKAFQNKVRIMPDTHWGAGAVIGFTMPLGNRVCPNTIGVDIGCGMLSTKVEKSDLSLEKIDKRVRDVVPTGFNKQNDLDYHILNDFPWESTNKKWTDFLRSQQLFFLAQNNGYLDDVIDHNYFQNTCKKIDYDEGTAIASIGTLGGGNHFIEIGEGKNGDWYITIHSGSRGFGYKIAQYWQDRATERRNADNDYDFDRKQLENLARDTFEGGKIGEVIGYLHQMQDTINDPDRNTDLDYLKDKEALGYYKDMILAQMYASENRKLMMKNICDVLNIEIKVQIESVHNFIDFEDGIIRKGATRVHKKEPAIIPLNMADGVLVVEGKGNEDWNKSVCHGAGRVMGRREAKRTLDEDKVQKDMEGVYSSDIPIDEAPDAYKPSDFIKENISETVTIKNHIDPILNIKDND